MKSPIFFLILLTASTGLLAGPIHLTYDAAGRLVLVDYGNGTNLFKIYDNAGNLIERSAPGPLLHSTRSGNQATFAWTSLATNWTLVSTPSLHSPITYSPVAVTPVVQNGQLIATINAPPGMIFFVLKR